MGRLPEAPFVYPILDAAFLAGRAVEEVAGALVAGGARMVQVRAKRTSDAELLELVRRALGVVRGAGALLVVNDRPDVALLAGADGVHVGQEDLPPAECRRLLGSGAVVGWSAHGLEQVASADATVLDYVALGPVFPTRTKEAADPVVGLETLRRARAATRLPLVAIGGITRQSAAAVVAAGADGVAAVSDLLGDDPAAAVRAMRGVLGR